MSTKCFSILVFTFLFISSCATVNTKYNSDLVNKSVKGSKLLNSHFTGFVLYDPESKKYLYELNADKYFTPGSNTKLFTFYAGLKILKDSIPAFRYFENQDSLVIYGTGDPTFLHPDFTSQRAYDFLRQNDKKLFVSNQRFQDAAFGPGWAWDDYEYYFQPERSGFPMYGNVVSFVKDSLDSVAHIEPKIFNNYTDLLLTKPVQALSNRSFEHNIFNFFPDTSRSKAKNRVPIKLTDEWLNVLLSDTLKKPVNSIHLEMDSSKVFYSRSAMEIYVLMLKASDNLIAEQILYLCADQMGVKLNSAIVRNYIIKNFLNDLASKPIWVDGSGLSRYNLMTPRSFINLLEKIKKEIPQEKILALLPIGGVDGTIKNWYAPEEEEAPYVFAKTGTLSNNHSLSGFVKTKKGKLLTFSFMNNNYSGSSSEVKFEMEKVLRMIRDRY